MATLATARSMTAVLSGGIVFTAEQATLLALHDHPLEELLPNWHNPAFADPSRANVDPVCRIFRCWDAAIGEPFRMQGVSAVTSYRFAAIPATCDWWDIEPVLRILARCGMSLVATHVSFGGAVMVCWSDAGELHARQWEPLQPTLTIIEPEGFDRIRQMHDRLRNLDRPPEGAGDQ